MPEVGMKAITFINGLPRLVEVVAITGKRARIRRPGAPLGAEVKSLPLSDLYAYNEEIWVQLQQKEERVIKIKASIVDLARGLNTLAQELQVKAEDTDGFWS